MDKRSDRSLSETELDRMDESTPTNYVTTRFNKRKREDVTASDLSSFKNEIRSMISSMLATHLCEIKKNTETLKEIQHTNRSIEDSISFLSSQYEDFQHKIVDLEGKIEEDRIHTQNLEQKIEELQRESRKTSFELKNVPKKPKESKEDLLNMVINLSNAINCPLHRSDIKDIYRVRPKQEGTVNTPIIIELVSTMVKYDILKMCKAHNIKHKGNLSTTHLGLQNMESSTIYVAEHLTAKASRLHFLARELKKRKVFKFCWTSYGRVYLRKMENSQIIPITSEAQLERLGKDTTRTTPVNEPPTSGKSPFMQPTAKNKKNKNNTAESSSNPAQDSPGTQNF